MGQAPGLLTNIRLSWNGLPATHTLTYNELDHRRLSMGAGCWLYTQIIRLGWNGLPATNNSSLYPLRMGRRNTFS
jgi:hypothetical protein